MSSRSWTLARPLERLPLRVSPAPWRRVWWPGKVNPRPGRFRASKRFPEAARRLRERVQVPDGGVFGGQARWTQRTTTPAQLRYPGPCWPATHGGDRKPLSPIRDNRNLPKKRTGGDRKSSLPIGKNEKLPKKKVGRYRKSKSPISDFDKELPSPFPRPR